jgi:hypothetical protein
MLRLEITAENPYELRMRLLALLESMTPLAAETVAAAAKPARKAKPVEADDEVAETAGNGSDSGDSMFDDPPPAKRKPGRPKKEEAVIVTAADVRKALTQLVDKHGEQAARAILKKHGDGATKVSLLDEEHYAQVHEAVTDALAS